MVFVWCWGGEAPFVRNYTNTYIGALYTHHHIDVMVALASDTIECCTIACHVIAALALSL